MKFMQRAISKQVKDALEEKEKGNRDDYDDPEVPSSIVPSLSFVIVMKRQREREDGEELKMKIRELTRFHQSR